LKKVVIIGAGYGGLRAIEKLAKEPGLDITLIDINPYHYMQTEAYGYIAGKFDICDITVDIKSWCSGFSKDIKFVNEEALDVDTKDQIVTTANQKLHYDELIIATGAKTNFPAFIEGLKDHTYGVKILDRAYDLKRKFEKIIYSKIRHSNDEQFNIIIGGAGLSGVEIAAEMAYIAKKFTGSTGIRNNKIHIYLVEAYDSILNGLDGYIIKNSVKRLDNLGVKVMTNSFIQKVGKKHIELKSGERIDFDFMIFTGGIKATGLNDIMETEKNKMNQFIVDEYLRLKGHENVYAIGDCAQIKNKDGALLPPTSQIAEQCAEQVAKNITAKEKFEDIQIYEGKIDGMFVALGGNYAVGTLFNKIKVKGYLAFLLKKAITKMYHYGLMLRVNNGYRLRR
jgi:NADH dehydrogenase